GAGVTNAWVVLAGTNFVSVSGVGFNGLSAVFTVDSPGQITAQVPAGATDGLLTVTNNYGVGTSANAFIIATNAVSPVSISQVFGGGGLSGAPYQNDFVELYNHSGSTVDMSTWSLQYASSAGTSWSMLNLSGSIAPGHYFLIQLSGGSTGSALPTPDLTSSSINLSSTKGKVALVSAQTVISAGTSSPIGLSTLQDFVGYGSADAYEGSGPAPTVSATVADLRAAAGAQDTDDNAADFTAGTPNPRNSTYGSAGAPIPVVTTSAAGNVTTNSVTLNGSLNPNSLPTTAQFEYGQTTNYGTVLVLPGSFIGTSVQAVSTNLTGLAAATTYHFRLTATNSAGFAAGADQTFTTAAVNTGGGTGGSNYSGLLAGWDLNGQTGYGASPLAPTTNAPGVAIVGLSRGAGLATAGTAASRCWGGNAWATTTSGGITSNKFMTFSLTVTNGGTLSLTSLPQFDHKRSSSGPTNGLLQAQVGGGTFIDLATFTFSSSGSSLGPVDLSTVSALQNIPAGTTVTFRMVGYNAGGTGGNWYVFDLANSTALDLSVAGTMAYGTGAVAPAIAVQPADTNTFVGKNAGFTVAASGTPPLTYQWRRDGASLTDNATFAGTTNPVLSILAAGTNLNGGYSVVVSNLSGSLTSRVAGLTVVPLPQLFFSPTNSGFFIGANGGAISNTVVLQMATNLMPPIGWRSVQTNSIDALGQIRFAPTNAGSAGYYRLWLP
ncbi:MAG TPA: lamin tail domain-containing protein, partial [Verrucomicrobiae bacterium]